jgi:hypothetical protein
MSADPHDEIAEAVQYGRMTPDEAETKLKDLGLPPLAPQPNPADYNPMGLVWWTLPMTVAWIVWRTSADVREAWDAFRKEGSFWVHERWRAGFDGPVYEGWKLRPLAPAKLSMLMLTEVHRRTEAKLPGEAISIGDATKALWRVLEAGALDGVGKKDHLDAPVPIPDHQWHNLAAIEEGGRDVVRHRERHGYSWRGYVDVSFRRQDVMAIWPPSRMEARGLSLPATMRPEGPGHMPLYCAAQWIATKGGTRDFDPTHATTWEQAYAELLARISSNQVTVTGVRNGVREKLDGYLFPSIAIDYPFADTSIDLFKDELHLESYAYVDDEHWRKGFDDCLRDRGGIQWSQLMVPKADVARWWPFNDLMSPPQTHFGSTGTTERNAFDRGRIRRADGARRGARHVARGGRCARYVGSDNLSRFADTSSRNNRERDSTQAPASHEIIVSWDFVAAFSWPLVGSCTRYASAFRGTDMRRL